MGPVPKLFDRASSDWVSELHLKLRAIFVNAGKFQIWAGTDRVEECGVFGAEYLQLSHNW